jgi:hypothetical protein
MNWIRGFESGEINGEKKRKNWNEKMRQRK